ncbi:MULTISPECIES: MFS transporter [unclassified Aureispira]|uniref:MFS transporter n=1 Tax=unclassified Aureispira TaxID=2649989 RepID=UPI000698A0AB|nr:MULTISPECIES: MFS transporter [unclassified Aureispira]WMX14446.1 MFS transporter [Aureispira sp. CCB-E]
MIKRILSDFAKVPSHILYLMGAVFFIQLIDASLFILFNFHLKKLGYVDSEIAHLISYKYAAVVLFAFPLGLLIKGRELLKFFRLASVITPTFILSVLFALEYGYTKMVYVLVFLFGMGTICISVTAMPFIILNTPKERHSEAVTLYFQVFSATAFVSGMLNYILNSIAPNFFTEGTVLKVFGLLGFTSVWFVSKIKVKENISNRVPIQTFLHAYEWKKIGIAVFPTILIATGAGLTIPFINLFFLGVHGIDSKAFSLFGSLSFVLVTIVMLFVPAIRRKWGYNVVVNGFQTLAVGALFIMASTEWYANWEWAAMIAVVAFLIRQPLMQVASPAITEMTMYYVGERNQEMMGALNASIWSGAWFFSSVIFGVLRAWEVAYVNIFMMTVVMYGVATLVYYWLIKDYERMKKAAPELYQEDSETS